MTAPHIAVLFEFPTLNGGEHSMLSVVEQLHAQERFRFSIIAPPTGPLAEKIGELKLPLVAFSVRDTNGTKRQNVELLEELSSVLDTVQPDVLHANSLSMSRLIGQMSTTTSRSFQRTGHLRDIIGLSKKVIADLNSNNRLVAVSDATRNFHIDQGLDLARCQKIYNGVDTDQFFPLGEEEAGDPAKELRSRVLPSIPSTARVVLNVGQICLRKGQLDVAQAVCRLLDGRDDIHLVLAGERNSGKQESIDFEQAIHDAFASAGHSDHLHRVGYQENIADLMRCCDLLVHAARQEPLGRVLLEAAASGLPIVATNVGGTAEILRDKADAQLVPASNPKALASAIQILIDDENAMNRYAKSARSRIVSTFSLAQATEHLATFWESQILNQ